MNSDTAVPLATTFEIPAPRGNRKIRGGLTELALKTVPSDAEITIPNLCGVFPLYKNCTGRRRLPSTRLAIRQGISNSSQNFVYAALRSSCVEQTSAAADSGVFVALAPRIKGHSRISKTNGGRMQDGRVHMEMRTDPDMVLGPFQSRGPSRVVHGEPFRPQRTCRGSTTHGRGCL